MVELSGPSEASGELAILDQDGSIRRRFVGLVEPTCLSPLGDDRFLVTDRGAGSILEVDYEGTVHWSWTCPPEGPRPLTATSLPTGTILVAAEQGGVAEVGRDGAILWHVPTPVQGHPVVGAVRLPDGSTMIAVRHFRRMLFHLAQGSTTATEIPVPVEQENNNFPYLVAWTQDGAHFVLGDRDWSVPYLGSYADGRLRLEPLPSEPAHQVVPDGTGGFAYVAYDQVVGRWFPDRPPWRVKTLYEPLAVAPTADPNQLLFGYLRLPDGSWPESRPPVPMASTIAWPRFCLWLGGAVLVVAGLNALAWLRGSAPGARKPIPEGGGAAAKQEVEVTPGPAASTGLRLLAVTALVAGLALAGQGHRLMVRDFARGWLAAYAGGAVLAAGALELWRRRGLAGRDPFWSRAVAARPSLEAGASLGIGLGLVVAGCAALFHLRRAGVDYTDQVGLWGGLLVVLLGMSGLADSPPWRRWRWPGREVLPLVLPLAVASVTLFYRLSDIPAKIHFDFVFTATSALDLLQGRCASIWENGFVPAPVIGLVPEMVGLVLAGPGELGFRLGGSLFGLSGVVAVYLLGTWYRNRTTGLVAALLLAGSIPFIHFSRLNANGDAATAGLWALTLLALAVRTGKPGAFILAGFASGYCFYLWPGARVAVVAGLAWAGVLSLRSWRFARARWFGPPLWLAAFAVWLVPLVPMWMLNPASALPRVEESMEVFKLSEGLNLPRLKESFGQPLADSFGWFFVRPDNSTQGTLSPGCNAFEAVLLAIGLAIAVGEGFSLNLLLLGQLVLVLVTLGAWAGSPPWYTRMVPSTPVAVLLMSRTVTGVLDLAAGVADRWRKVLVAAVAVAVTVVSPASNLRRYVRFESGADRLVQLNEMTAIGRRLRNLGPRYHYYLVITKRPDWVADASRQNGRFGELLPFIWNLHVSEIRDLPVRLPLPAGEPAGVVVQAERFAEDVAVLKGYYPDARVEELRGFQGELLAGLVLVENP